MSPEEGPGGGDTKKTPDEDEDKTGRAGGDSDNLMLMFFVVVGVLVFGGGGFLLYRQCFGSKGRSGGDQLAGHDWTAAGAGDTFAFGDDLAGGGAGPGLGVFGRLRLMMRRMRRGGVNEGIAMGQTMQFHTLEDF